MTAPTPPTDLAAHLATEPSRDRTPLPGALPPPSRGTRAALALSLALVFVVFLPTVRFGFVNWDDDIHVYASPLLRPDAPLRARLTTPTLGYPIPLTVASYRLEAALFGLRPAVFHCTNVALHLLSCALLFTLARRLRLTAPACALATVLFGLAPVVAEPVSWISGRKDLLATALLLAALNAHVAPRARAPRLREGLAVGLALAAALAKPSAQCAPLLVFAYERLVARATLRTTLRRVAPYALVAAPIALLALRGQQQVGAVVSPGFLLLLRRVFYALGYHLGLLVGLQPSCVKHIPVAMPPPFEPRVDLLPLVLVPALLLTARALSAPTRRAGLFALAFALAAYLPNANIAPLVRFLAETYLYLPLAGLALFAAAALESALAHATLSRAPLLRAAIPAAVGLALVSPTLAASSKWHDGVALFAPAVARYPDSPQLCRSLGNAHYLQGAPQVALTVYAHCARRFGIALYRHNIAVTLRTLGRDREADALEPPAPP